MAVGGAVRPAGAAAGADVVAAARGGRRIARAAAVAERLRLVARPGAGHVRSARYVRPSLRAGAGAVARAGVAAGWVGRDTGRPARSCRPGSACTFRVTCRRRSGRCRRCGAAADAVDAVAADALIGAGTRLAVGLERAALRRRALAGERRDTVAVDGAAGVARVGAAAVGRAALRARRRAGARAVAVRDRGEGRARARLRAARNGRGGELAGARAVAGAGVAAGRVRPHSGGPRCRARREGAVPRARADVARLAQPARAGAAADAVDAEVAGEAFAGRSRTPGRGASCCRSGSSADRRCWAAGSRRRPCTRRGTPSCRCRRRARRRGSSPSGRRPAPSQVRLGRVDGPAGHEAPAHAVLAAYRRQAPMPSQSPSVPQLAAPWSAQRDRSRRRRSAMLLQVPRDAGSAHDWQMPVQARPAADALRAEAGQALVRVAAASRRSA